MKQNCEPVANKNSKREMNADITWKTKELKRKRNTCTDTSNHTQLGISKTQNGKHATRVFENGNSVKNFSLRRTTPLPRHHDRPPSSRLDDLLPAPSPPPLLLPVLLAARRELESGKQSKDQLQQVV